MAKKVKEKKEKPLETFDKNTYEKCITKNDQNVKQAELLKKMAGK